MKNEKAKINNILIKRQEIVNALKYYTQDEEYRKQNLKDFIALTHDLSIYDKILNILGVEITE